jgi:2-polyprenyl-3-methyl-5-hydroxy-6-metoxy-1,4-benzoquinol methylase
MEPPLQANCPACESKGPHRNHEVREMMYGTREVFEYSECNNCLSLFINRIPDDLGRHYADGYYSFGGNAVGSGGWNPAGVLRQWLKTRWMRHALGFESVVGSLLTCLKGKPEIVKWMEPCDMGISDRILDVGCGGGILLSQLEEVGFRYLTGIDPFLDADQQKGGVRLRKCHLEQVNEEYDLIMMHHSLEHMTDPAATLAEARRLLSGHGRIIVRVPLAQSAAHKEYGTCWVEWDAPRHLFIPSEGGMAILAEKAGLSVEHVSHDGNAFQFVGSELYLKDIPLTSAGGEKMFTRSRLREFTARASALNDEKRGGRAIFILRKQRG